MSLCGGHSHAREEPRTLDHRGKEMGLRESLYDWAILRGRARCPAGRWSSFSEGGEDRVTLCTPGRQSLENGPTIGPSFPAVATGPWQRVLEFHSG